MQPFPWETRLNVNASLISIFNFDIKRSNVQTNNYCMEIQIVCFPVTLLNN